MSRYTYYIILHGAKVTTMVVDVVPWLVNVAVSEIILMRMRICGQLANIINPIHAKYSPRLRAYAPRTTVDESWQQ